MCWCGRALACVCAVCSLRDPYYPCVSDALHQDEMHFRFLEVRIDYDLSELFCIIRYCVCLCVCVCVRLCVCVPMSRAGCCQ